MTSVIENGQRLQEKWDARVVDHWNDWIQTLIVRVVSSLAIPPVNLRYTKKRTHTPHPLTSQIVNGDIFHRCFQDVYAVSGMLYNDNRSLMPTERNEHIVYSERYSLPVLRYGEFHLESVHEGNE
jgi:hypothetical protein